MSVYFISAPSVGAVKVGFAGDAIRRFREIQRHSPVDLVLVGVVDGGPELERRLHTHFFSFHMRHEWFWLRPPVSSCIKELIAGTFDMASLPKRGLRAWAMERRKSGNPISPNGKPYAVPKAAPTPRENAA